MFGLVAWLVAGPAHGQDVDAGLAEHKAACEQGEATSCLYLGLLHHRAVRLAKDEEVAKPLLEAACQADADTCGTVWHLTVARTPDVADVSTEPCASACMPQTPRGCVGHSGVVWDREASPEDEVVVRVFPSDDMVNGPYNLTVEDVVTGESGTLRGWDLYIVSNFD